MYLIDHFVFCFLRICKKAFSQHQRQDRAKALKRHTQSLDGDAFASKAVLS
eukprot:m.165980 g.165980  ORF g.165980 m.165980 type:complete len:51 (+) comp13441_c3_seq18:1302-1454(+)